MSPSALVQSSDSPQTGLAKTQSAIAATPVTEVAFARYGGLVAAGLQLTKSVGVVPTTNTYAQAPSQVPGRHVIRLEVVESKVPDAKIRTLVLDRLERHPFTSQTFIPMGSELSYLAIVADGNAAGDAPDLSTLKVFTVGEGQGICYDAGVWHASMHVVSKKPITFVVVQSLNGVPEEDCEVVLIPQDSLLSISF